MSTHRHSLRGYRNTCVPLFLIGCGLLLALQLCLASVAFASSAHSVVGSSGISVPKDAAGAPTDQAFARASISVVRLIVSYTDPNNATPPIACTGLGVLVKSQPGGAPAPNDWVLTDGSLVNANQPVCANTELADKLSQIQISLNTTYHSKNQIPFKINTDSLPPINTAVTCSDNTNCSNGPALIAFQGEEAPFVDLTTSSAANANHAAIALTSAAGASPGASDTPANDTQFLTPQPLDPQTKSKLEPGTPFIDAAGQLTSLASTASIPLDAMTSLVDQIPSLPNTVNTEWKAGITAYYTKKYALAQADFQQAAKDNPNFQGAKDFATFAQNALNPSSSTTSSQPTGPGFFLPGTNIFLGLWESSVVALVFFALLLLLATLLFSPRVQRRRAFKADLGVADRRAASLAHEIERLEASQRDFVEHNRTSEQPTFPIQQQALQDKTLVRQPPREIHCPSCGEVVMPDANYCPNCRQLLSPTESGLHRRIRLSAAPAQSPSPANPYGNSQSRSAPPPPSMAPMDSVADQPTMVPTGSVADQPTMVPMPPPMSPTNPVEEHSPLQRGPNVTMKFSDAIPDEMTLPLKRLGFLVGTRSDPGIKRKYKPNEDSLLAAQGLVSLPVLQPFGLFVVADGMGGHANGQDASRLAIQMIVETVLPKLVTDVTGSIDYAKVLVEGIQSANQAVHQQNVDKRGDMGTTITSALVVGTHAYVVNVGDSRTYLYREAKGLQKITNDHSVVASLVDAGIIKPDDIYTHPKRNQIYRSLGEKATVEVDEFTFQLRQGDKLLLCSDGLWDMVRDPKIEEVIRRPVPDPLMTGDALIQSALEGGGEDNVTVIVVQMTEGRNVEALPRLQVLAKPDTVQLPQF